MTTLIITSVRVTDAIWDGCEAGDVLDYTNNSGRSNTYRLYALSSVFQARSAPAAITDLAAMAGVGKVTLSWTEPDNGGSSITGYDYRQRISSGTTWDPDWTGEGTPFQ